MQAAAHVDPNSGDVTSRDWNACDVGCRSSRFGIGTDSLTSKAHDFVHACDSFASTYPMASLLTAEQIARYQQLLDYASAVGVAKGTRLAR
jgi:hypothetical protein